MGDSGNSIGQRALRVAIFWLATWVACAAVWMLLVDDPALPELLTGAVVAVLAATTSELVRAQRMAEIRIEPAWLARAWRPLARAPIDLVLLSRAAVLQLFQRRARRGRFLALRFPNGPRSARDNARRALAEAAGSFAPNTYVVGVDPERDLILVHQLVPAAPDKRPATIDPLELR